mmetsp:Transcript_37956/g.80375  ORF Transcript_37956/g.80375 Transcript_37956/m.80375 type:complete len:121 (-) Transcript_37956:474-836(-)
MVQANHNRVAFDFDDFFRVQYREPHRAASLAVRGRKNLARQRHSGQGKSEGPVGGRQAVKEHSRQSSTRRTETQGMHAGCTECDSPGITQSKCWQAKSSVGSRSPFRASKGVADRKAARR